MERRKDRYHADPTTNQLNVLNKLKIPYIHILPTEEMIRDSIKSAVNAIRLKQQSQDTKAYRPGETDLSGAHHLP